MKEYLLVSQRLDFLKDRNEIRESLDRRLVLFLKECGFFCIPISNVYVEDVSDFLQSLNLKGIVLSGGNDLGEFTERDELEQNLIKYAIDNDLPIIGICRGMQMLVHFFGGSLSRINGHVGIHPIISCFIDFPEVVPSFHNIGIDFLSKDFSILAKGFDNTIEAVKHNTYKMFGIMWHPERRDVFDKREIDFLKQVFN